MYVYCVSSVVDPNALNLDPYPEFWPNLDPDLGLCDQFSKKKFSFVREKHFSFINSFQL